MRPLDRALLVLITILLTAPAALAQKERQQFLVPIPERLTRATVDGEGGLKLWAEYEAEKCINCKGQKTMPCLHCERFEEGQAVKCPECQDTKKAVCRICAGTGEMPDILLHAPCPTCFGASLTVCFICGGRGQTRVEGGGDRPQKCGCCDGVGGFPCGTCNGQRWVETPKLKPSCAEAPSKELLKAIEVLEQTMAAVDAFGSAGNGRDDIKVLAKALKGATRYFPALKATEQHFERATKDQSKGSIWQHYEDAVKASAESTKQALGYYFKHQKRVLELCLERAEHNEGMKK